jgi:hypothetical protein
MTPTDATHELDDPCPICCLYPKDHLQKYEECFKDKLLLDYWLGIIEAKNPKLKGWRKRYKAMQAKLTAQNAHHLKDWHPMAQRN